MVLFLHFPRVPRTIEYMKNTIKKYCFITWSVRKITRYLVSKIINTVRWSEELKYRLCRASICTSLRNLAVPRWWSPWNQEILRIRGQEALRRGPNSRKKRGDSEDTEGVIDEVRGMSPNLKGVSVKLHISRWGRNNFATLEVRGELGSCDRSVIEAETRRNQRGAQWILR